MWDGFQVLPLRVFDVQLPLLFYSPSICVRTVYLKTFCGKFSIYFLCVVLQYTLVTQERWIILVPQCYIFCGQDSNVIITARVWTSRNITFEMGCWDVYLPVFLSILISRT